MSAYLQAGDKIHLSIPASVLGKDEERAEALRAEYAQHGIEVILVTDAKPGSPVEVISVIRQAPPGFEDWLPASAD